MQNNLLHSASKMKLILHMYSVLIFMTIQIRRIKEVSFV